MTLASVLTGRRLAKAVASRAQAEDAAGPIARGGLRLRTLVLLRWASLAAQAVAILAIQLTPGLHAPLLQCLSVMAAAAALNVGIQFATGHDRLTASWEAALQLGFDILQLSALLFFTGGAANPFSLLLVAPVALAAATLPARYALSLGVLTVACAAALAFYFLPVPWTTGGAAVEPLSYRLTAVAAIVTGILFSAGYAWRASREAARMQLALDVTQSVLAREQRLSALGGLAAAAAHELGTPLATISVVAKEMVREAPEGALREDAQLLMSQAERCREILRRLTETPEQTDEMHGRMSLTQFLNEIIEPKANAPVRVEALVTGPPGTRAPDIRRMPEVIHAMASFLDNAIDFAASEVLVTARFDDRLVTVEVRDDGPGFAPEVLARLGQPYITSRPSGEGSKSGHTGMGLGFFIAKTLLERTGAEVDFRNGKPSGALVSVRWPRESIETPPLT
ncbi:MAG TPA: ActS/PrrB/RegB family redox-sensitive histidine kinase [Caulobacteraceae bacterium]|jgi:two-component system sensor histidine kinase RegB